MEDTQKQDKLPPIKYTKRVGHLFEHVRDLDNHQEVDHAKDQPESQDDHQSCIRIHPERTRHGFSYIGYIVNSDSQRFYEKWVRPFVNIKQLKGVIADEDRKQHQASVAV